MIKTNLVIHPEPGKFNELLNEYIKKAENDGFHLRDIKYGDNMERFSALLILVKLNK